MKVNIIGRIQNIHLSAGQGMLPIYEAVINSIHATAETAHLRTPEITIKLIRDISQGVLDEEGVSFAPIRDVQVSDNGIGFDSGNFTAFTTSDTQFKSNLGGKGIGRFLWLKAFGSVHIESVFEEKGRQRKRSFDFTLTNEGIQRHRQLDAPDEPLQTTVLLRNMKEAFQRGIPKKLSTLAYQMIEHLLAFFILQKPPSIKILDTSNNESLFLDQLFTTDILPNLRTYDLSIKKSSFGMSLVRLYSAMASVHKLYYCAHGREVKQEDLRNMLPLLDRKLPNGSGGEYVLLAYLTGQLLDDNVNQERTSFYLSENISDMNLLYDQLISLQEIRIAVITKIKDILSDVLEPLRERHIERIRNFVQKDNPEYRSVLKYRAEQMETIAPGVTDEKLEIELHRLSQSIELEIKEDSTRLLSLDPKDISTSPEYRDQYEHLVEKVNDFGKGKLAEYVLHRNIVLRLLERRLQTTDSGGYEKEESIHGLVFPMKVTSEEVPFDKQNLWLIDEKLAYHYYLASDLPINKYPVVDSESKKRPDLMIFNHPLAFVEDEPPYSSVVIIEFKRPLKQDYTESENPIDQVQNYIRDIGLNQAHDKTGRPLNVRTDTPFYAYIICDLTDKIREFAVNRAMTKTPDGIGYFGFNPNLNCYTEIISFDKLLQDSKRRNHVLFEKLGLSGR